jgi:hypothetical protein
MVLKQPLCSSPSGIRELPAIDVKLSNERHEEPAAQDNMPPARAERGSYLHTISKMDSRSHHDIVRIDLRAPLDRPVGSLGARGAKSPP